ncbi:tRNA 2-thiouridine(34) synthase MnmA [Candidatus Kaiserbacteria bacterium CG10_big_fil_rev_8_21_14_0_10_45_20]|uniref:tRNA-specific 2-thiouridylase MnmA n=1 Tax=Candidatus Kaiserbacteria bacterium CG10_big_fil_rev_8_21_14_0_10_45_20 TaxID=1974607 RepID=A0A2H0UGQ2_9BACT|nr:MAG: tRNA 2-thiouridine(34) synthase MnmA [Candidatus Kaiserbacteria bacterium CG10_big_fil_rev_8_21_14_0_10_45_20]
MKIFVGLSGGVDSAVSAYLLKKAGHDVTGVFLKVWEPDFLPCTGAQDRLDAMRVAGHLQIPFKTYDVEEEYKESVVEYLLSEYKEGRTPNPDVMCNRAIKFGIFWERAKKDGAEAIATGHYARNEKHGAQVSQGTNKTQKTEHKLLRGVDETKDQSYFLWTLTQDDLSHTLFPVGGVQKKEVRSIASSVGLPNATKKDSQGICFLGHVDMAEFLKRYIPVEEGIIRDIEGNAVGKHEGVAFYTLGQHVSTSTPHRLYVIKKNKETNELVVSESETVSDTKQVYVLEKVNWVSEAPRESGVYQAQIRYRGAKYPVRVTQTESQWSIVFEESVLIAKGQSVVLYENERCLGGGIVQ